MSETFSIIYYSSSQEDSEFERKIQKTIKENSGGLPIISVTQKPTDFGTNICVGDVGASGFNMLRQIQIACEAAKTRFVIHTEADCLYPPDYFTFKPERDDVCYRNTNTYLMGYNRDYFWKKNEGGTWCQVVNREFLIKRLKELFKGQPMWDTSKKNFPKEIGQPFFTEFEKFTTANPCVSFKTGKGMRRFSHSQRIPIYELPYWGKGEDVKKKYDS